MIKVGEDERDLHECSRTQVRELDGKSKKWNI